MIITIAGDICVTPDAVDVFRNDASLSAFAPLSEMLRKSDFSVYNMECPSTECQTKVMKVGPCHKTTPDAVDYLAKVGFRCASIANNHIFDFGQTGLNDTVDALKRNHVGIIGKRDSENPYWIVEHHGVKVGIISFVDDEFNGNETVYNQINVFDPLDSFDQIRALKEQCSFVVVLYHGGLEQYEYPTPYLQRVCRKMVDDGADFVTCQHSHCIGSEEIYKGKHILYGQGNTYFYRKSNRSAKWNSAVIVQLTVERELSVKYSFVQTKENGYIVNGDGESDVRGGFCRRNTEIQTDGFIARRFSEACSDKNRFVTMLCLLSGRSKIEYYLHKICRGVLLRWLLNQEKTMAMSNVIRCAVHREVIQEILKQKHFQ